MVTRYFGCTYRLRPKPLANVKLEREQKELNKNYAKTMMAAKAMELGVNPSIIASLIKGKSK